MDYLSWSIKYGYRAARVDGKRLEQPLPFFWLHPDSTYWLRLNTRPQDMAPHIVGPDPDSIHWLSGTARRDDLLAYAARSRSMMFDFQDGRGPVLAHRHPTGGGIVANTAYVAQSVYVEDTARVFGRARVHGEVRIFQEAQVYGAAQVYGEARIFQEAQIYGRARIGGCVRVGQAARVHGNARILGPKELKSESKGVTRVYGLEIKGFARVYGQACITGRSVVAGTAQACGDAEIYDTRIKGSAVIRGGTHRLGEIS